MAYEKDFEPFQLAGDDLIAARKASADIQAALRVMAKIVQKHHPSLSSGSETVAIDFDPKASGSARDGQTHSGGPGPCYIYHDPPGICKPCPR